MTSTAPATDVAQVADPPSCPTCSGIDAVRFTRHDRSTPPPFCLTCGREIPTAAADLRKHGWHERALAELQDRAG